MEGADCLVNVELTRDEAYEILSRCLQSIERDNPTFHTAIRKLARAIESEGDTYGKVA